MFNSSSIAVATNKSLFYQLLRKKYTPWQVPFTINNLQFIIYNSNTPTPETFTFPVPVYKNKHEKEVFMKKLFVSLSFLTLLLTLSVSVSCLYADVYIKEKLHTDSYYYGGVTTPAENNYNETWISARKMAYITENRITIIDTEKKRGCIVFRKDRTYTETTLPMDLTNLVPENLAAYLKTIQYQGAVRETGNTKTIGKFKCKSYEVNAFVYYEGSKANETDTTVWVSTTVPFDPVKFKDMADNLYRLRNYSDPMIAQLRKIKGYPIFSTTLFYPKGFSVKSTAEIVEISSKDPPPHIYSVPEGFKKKEKLSIRDLRNR
jgi:hypothetical protein